MKPKTCPLCHKTLELFVKDDPSKGLECYNNNDGGHHYQWHVDVPVFRNKRKNKKYEDWLYDGDLDFELETIYYTSGKIVTNLKDTSGTDDKLLKRWNRQVELNDSILDMVRNLQLLQ